MKERSERKRKRQSRRGAAVWLVAVLCALCLCLAGCSGRTGEEKVRDLEFTVVSETDVPAELAELITEKKTSPFKLTFSDAQNLYIVIGYGPQETGGCSIAVHELYLTDNAIVVDTELLGPEIGENPPAETSWPVVIICTELLEQPVIFQ